MPYTSYLDPTKWNRFMEEAIINAIDERFNTDQNQKWKDEMSGFINTNVLIQNIGNNSLNLAPIVITNIVNTSGALYTLFTNIPFSTQAVNAVIDIQGVSGFTTFQPNGQFTVLSTTKTVKGYTQININTGVASGGGTYIKNSGTFSFQNTGNLIANQLIDYIHLLNIKCKFTKPIYQPTVIGSTAGTPIVVSLNYFNNLRSSSLWNNVMVTMSGWNTNTSANGTFFIKIINDLNFELYSDINLQNPIVGIANETNSSVSFGLTYYNSANKYLSTQKINTLSIPTWDNPNYELQGNRINLYPMNIINNVITTPCTEVTIDYVCKPKLPYVNSQQNDAYSGIYLDGDDTAFDLSTIAPEKFWFSVSDNAALAYSGGSARDQELQQATGIQLQKNP